MKRIPVFFGNIVTAFICVGFFGCPNQDMTKPYEKSRSNTFPTGIDTIRSWNSGRFQIVLDALYDDKAPGSPSILKLIRSYTQDGDFVYFLSEDYFAILNLINGNFEKNKLSDVSEDKVKYLIKLENPSKHSDVHKIPIINR